MLSIAGEALHEAVVGCLRLGRYGRIDGGIHFIDATSHRRQLLREVVETVKSPVFLLQDVLLSSDAVLHELHPVQLCVDGCFDVWHGSARCLRLAGSVARLTEILALLGMKR